MTTFLCLLACSKTQYFAIISMQNTLQQDREVFITMGLDYGRRFMKNMFCVVGVSLALILGGCASMGSMYATCDQSNERFSDVASCTKAALKADSRYGFHNGYIRYANRAMAAVDVLDEKVAARTVSEKEARYQMHEILAAMQSQIAAEVAAIDVPTKSTVRTNCTSYGSTINCTSR